MAAKARAERHSNKGTVQKQQFYLFQFSYTSDAWNYMLRNPGRRDRIAAVKELVSLLGGCFPKIQFDCNDPPEVREKWITFGEYDVVTMIAFPTDETAATFAMIISAGGGVKSFKTTRLLPWDLGMSAMKKGRDVLDSYKPPGAK